MNLNYVKKLNNLQKLEVEVFIVILILIIWSLIFSNVEGVNLFDSFYFSVITIAGIWYWDIVPHTNIWKIIVMIYAFIWIPLFVSMWYLITSIISYPLKKNKKTCK